MGIYELECEFDVVRRMGWSDEDLAEHIDDIFERLHQANDIQRMSAEANLDTGRSRLSVEVSAEDGSVDDDGRGEFGEELQVWMVGSEQPGENLPVCRGRVYLLHGIVDFGAFSHG